ncbi:BH0509 family protein [Ectobacillus polymachus]
MARKERKNMIEFIAMNKGLHKDTLIFMTDAEIEHIYNVTYFHLQEIAE